MVQRIWKVLGMQVEWVDTVIDFVNCKIYKIPDIFIIDIKVNPHMPSGNFLILTQSQYQAYSMGKLNYIK